MASPAPAEVASLPHAVTVAVARGAAPSAVVAVMRRVALDDVTCATVQALAPGATKFLVRRRLARALKRRCLRASELDALTATPTAQLRAAVAALDAAVAAYGSALAAAMQRSGAAARLLERHADANHSSGATATTTATTTATSQRAPTALRTAAAPARPRALPLKRRRVDASDDDSSADDDDDYGDYGNASDDDDDDDVSSSL